MMKVVRCDYQKRTMIMIHTEAYGMTFKRIYERRLDSAGTVPIYK
jgi:hypothetical protein